MLERKHLIGCEQSKHGKVYSITENGRELIEGIPTTVKDIQSFAPTLFDV
jgi:DNA-binding PadR family transcriptional regulator